MSKPVKVYNKGIKPIVYKRGRTGTETIHPGKFVFFEESIAEAIVEKFENACTEKEYKETLKAKEAEPKKAEKEVKKKGDKK